MLVTLVDLPQSVLTKSPPCLDPNTTLTATTTTAATTTIQLLLLFLYFNYLTPSHSHSHTKSLGAPAALPYSLLKSFPLSATFHPGPLLLIVWSFVSSFTTYPYRVISSDISELWRSMHTRGFLFLLLLIPLIDSFWDKGGDDGYGGGGGKGKGGGGKGSGTACTVKGSYCQVKRTFNFHISFAPFNPVSVPLLQVWVWLPQLWIRPWPRRVWLVWQLVCWCSCSFFFLQWCVVVFSIRYYKMCEKNSF